MSILQDLNLKCIALVFLCFVICTNADTPGFLDTRPGSASSELESSCAMKPLQDSICCVESTFSEDVEAEKLLHNLLQNVPGPDYEMYGVDQYLYNSTETLEVGINYLCDVPLGAEGVPGLGCQKCLQHIVDEIAGGISSQNGRCRNSLAMRFGYIYEPDTPWGEDTTWCHLDYWLKPASPSKCITGRGDSIDGPGGACGVVASNRREHFTNTSKSRIQMPCSSGGAPYLCNYSPRLPPRGISCESGALPAGSPAIQGVNNFQVNKEAVIVVGEVCCVHNFVRGRMHWALQVIFGLYSQLLPPLLLMFYGPWFL